MSKSSAISDGAGARIPLRGWAVMSALPQATGLTVAGCCYPTIFRPFATIGFNVWANNTPLIDVTFPVTRNRPHPGVLSRFTPVSW